MRDKNLKSNNHNSKYVFDSDADGLSDVAEKKLGTDPFNVDTDNDGLGDLEEVYIYHTNPLDPDTDKDSISDGDEVRLGLNPLGGGLLKDLFIPHKGNDYKPHAVRPKHLIWHGAFAIMIKMVVFISIIALPTTALLTPDILKDQSKKIVAMTNTIRSNFDLGILSENILLNEGALLKAEDMSN